MNKIFLSQVAQSTPFDKTTTIGQIIDRDNTQEAIEQAYQLAKGIRTFPYELHYVSGTGLNTSMSNGTWFRVRPGIFPSGSNSGYPAAFPIQMPFKCKLYSIILTFREAAFDYNIVSGPILFEIENNGHLYNSSIIRNRMLVRFGNWSGNSTGHSTHRFELFYNDTGGEGFEYIDDATYEREFDYAEMLGCRFVKAPVGVRRINSFRDIVMKLNFEEVVT